MKKTILFGAAALVMLAACNKQEAAQPESKTFTLSATVEQQEEPGTKSTLSGITVSWTASTDVIKVYNADGSANTDLTAQSSGTSTTFSGGDLSGVPTVAIFPAGIASGYNGSVISFTLPSSQDYVANSFDSDANVAVASVSACSLAFKNVCGTLKLSVTGNYTVSKIEVTGANNEKLWGAFKTTVATEPVLSVDGDPTTAEKTLTLNCGAGVALDPETATVFYIVVPQGVFTNGFTAKVYSKEAEAASETYTFTTILTGSDNTVGRSRIRKMPVCEILPPAYQKVAYLENQEGGWVNDTSSGISQPGAWINTGITPNINGSVEMKFMIKGDGWDVDHTTCSLFGGYDSNTRNFGLCIVHNGISNNRYYFLDGAQRGVGGESYTNFEKDIDYIIVYNALGKTLQVNGGAIETIDVNNDSYTGPSNFYIYLFTNASVGSSMTQYNKMYTFHGRIYYFNYYDAGVLTHKLIPCDKKDGSGAGFYDILTGIFHENESDTYNFVTGAPVYH